VGKSTTAGLFLVVENYKVGSLFPYDNKVGGLPVFYSSSSSSSSSHHHHKTTPPPPTTKPQTTKT